MKTVVIPNNESIWTCSINGVTYSYPGGSTQTVPDEVAMMIMQTQGYPPAEPEPEMPWVPKDDTIVFYISGTSSTDIQLNSCSKDKDEIFNILMQGGRPKCVAMASITASNGVVNKQVYNMILHAQYVPASHIRVLYAEGFANVTYIQDPGGLVTRVFSASVIDIFAQDSGSGWGEWTTNAVSPQMIRGSISLLIDKTATKKVQSNQPVTEAKAVLDKDKSYPAAMCTFFASYKTHDAKNTILKLDGIVVHDSTGSRIEFYYNGAQLCYVTIENNAWVYNEPASEE